MRRARDPGRTHQHCGNRACGAWKEVCTIHVNHVIKTWHEGMSRPVERLQLEGAKDSLTQGGAGEISGMGQQESSQGEVGM